MTSSGFADNNYLFLNRELLQDEEYALTGAVDLGWFEKGETITVQMYLNGDLTYLQMPLFYGFDAEAFHQDCETLKAKGMTDMVQSQTEISGTVQVDSPQGEVLVTSIPADPGWTVLVDGQKVQPQTMLDGFLTVALKKGSHRISFVYCPAGLKAGGAVSIASAVLGILAWYWCRRRRKRAAGNLRLKC